mgnify:CR=1 FL=1
MTLDEIIGEMGAAHAEGLDVARVHSGDPSLFGAIAEQMRRLDALRIDYDVTPGVPAFAAAEVKRPVPSALTRLNSPIGSRTCSSMT